jgi:hypothetical protein
VTEADRRAVVILGMHRSGTSTLAGSLTRLGLAEPMTPLPAADDNPGGFYESLPVVMANYTMLLDAGCAWNVCLTFDPDRLALMTPADRLPMREIIAREFPPNRDFVLKDPRLCLTLPAWLPALRESGALVSALIVVRHPLEVVRSLSVRNGLEEAATAAHWLHHMLEAERATRGLPRAVVFYDALMRDWRACLYPAARTAGIRLRDSDERVVDAFVSGAKRHHAAAEAAVAIGPSPVSEMIEAVWISFRRLLDDPASAVPLGTFDQVRTRFAGWRAAACPPGFRVVFPAA